jgi:uncharacterized glyoxalase superfamily protein PhnB
LRFTNSFFTPDFMKITSFIPNLITRDMAATLAFYTELLDFKVGMNVPEEAPFVWAQITHGPVELMWQTADSFEEDLGIAGDRETGGTLLFHTQVEDIKGWFERLDGKVKMATPMRETFYGMREFGFWDPNGYLIVLAERMA